VEKSRLILTLAMCCLLAVSVAGCGGGPTTTTGVSTAPAVTETTSTLASQPSTTGVSTASTVPATTTTATMTTAASGVWTDLKPSGATPPARSSHAMVYDTAGDKVILFGGFDAADFNDTWAYDPAANAWTDLKPSGATPPARHDHAMAYDAGTGRMILFGGTMASTAKELNDTWAYDPAANTWTDLKPAGAVPDARVGHAMAYDPVARRVILFGGSSHGGRQGDIWAYDSDANTWTQLSPTGSTPSARYGCPLAYDSGLGKVLLVGGSDGHFVTMHETWAYDSAANAWTKLSPQGTVPPGRAYFGMAYDADAHRTVIFGGQGVTPLDDTWAYDSAGNAWTKVDPTGAVPSARMYPAMVYATKAGKMILFGGSDGKTVFNDTWSFGLTP
jgi:N-acetylneuraminic acid mutarotase